MKKFAFVLCILFLLSLLGCSQGKTSDQIPATTQQPVSEDVPQPTETEEAAAVPQTEETEPPTMQMVEKEPAVSTLDTPYYTLTVPQDWAYDCLYDIIELENDAYNLILYEKQGYEDWKAGNLFSILLLKPEQDFTIYPSYEVIGTLQSPDWIFNVAVLYPTDVQFSEDTAQVYNRLSAQIPSVLESFTAKDSCGFIPGQITEPRNRIVTPYYTLSLPDNWVNACTTEIVERENGAYNLIVREALSFQEFGGGKLFSILLLPQDADYTQYPSYEYLGTLESPDWEFHVVVLYPTDVQFSENTAQNYNDLSDTVSSVIHTIEGLDGSCYFYPAN